MQNRSVFENPKYLQNNNKLKKNVFANMQKGSDLWLTPQYAVEILIPFLDNYKNKIIWCPFDTEESQFVKILRANNFKVVFSHIEKNQDFFQYEPKKWDILISNPPWSLKDKILKKAYSFNKPFALLLPIHALSGKFRYQLFKENKLDLLLSENRICYEGIENKHNRPPFESAYFTFKFLPSRICHEK